MHGAHISDSSAQPILSEQCDGAGGLSVAGRVTGGSLQSHCYMEPGQARTAAHRRPCRTGQAVRTVSIRPGSGNLPPVSTVALSH